MLERLISLLDEKQRFFITTHIRPDGDALGSQLALGQFLKKLGKEVALINSDPPPYNLDWLPGIDSIEVFDGSMSQRESIGKADVVLILDTNSYERLGKLSGPVKGSSGVKVLVDHHTNPENWFDLKHARETASSTGELVYEIIAGHDAGLIDTSIATTLYTAIMTDTGSFRYSHVSPQLHRIVADLLERGDITPTPIHTAIYDTRSMQSLRLLGRVLESMTLLYEGQVGYVVISQRILRDTGAGNDDTGGFVNYVLSVEGVRAAVLFYETDTGTKMSFRSKGDTYVNEWARAFGGGGHRNASGAYLTRPLDEAIDMVMSVAPRYIHLEQEESENDLSADDMSYLSSLMEMKEKG